MRVQSVGQEPVFCQVLPGMFDPKPPFSRQDGGFGHACSGKVKDGVLRPSSVRATSAVETTLRSWRSVVRHRTGGMPG